MNKNTQKGFTLLELMVVLVIIGILAAIAVPTYQGQVKRAKFAEVIGATMPYKASVAACLQKNNGTVTTCDTGSGGIPAAPAAYGNLASLTVTDGVIKATGTAAVDNLIYWATPSYSSGVITWNLSATDAVSTCIAAGVCD